MSRRRAGLLLLVLALGVHAGLAVHTMAGNAATFDEGTHLPAGYTYLTLGDHRLNPEQPPLVKLLAAAPLLLLRPAVKTDHVAWTSARQWEFGRRFLYVWNDGGRLLFLGRLPIVGLSLALLAAVFARSRRLFGPAAAAISLGLAVFSPDLLAHGNLVTTDVAVALFVFLAVGAFEHLVERPSGGWLVATGLAAGAALAAKFSGLVLVPILLVLGAASIGAERPAGPWGWRTSRVAFRRARGGLLLLVAVGGLALLVVWASYGFRGALSPEPAVRSRLRAPLEEPHGRTWQRMAVTAADLDLVPEDYVRGLLFVMKHSEGRRTFLCGRLSESGFPYYFPATVLFKTPIPLLVLVLLALVRIPRLPPRKAAFLWAPVAIYTGLALGRGLQIGHRHLLPLLPFLLVAAGEAAHALVRWRRPVGAVLVAVLGTWYVGGTLRNHPHHLAYFNEAAGGPANGWKVLVDSNLDWGQDLKRLTTWMAARRVAHIKLSYFGSADPAYYGIDCERLPGYSAPHAAHITREIRPGDLVAVSATNLQGVYLDAEDRPLMERLRRLDPVGRAGRSILIYRPRFSWPPPAGIQTTQ